GGALTIALGDHVVLVLAPGQFGLVVTRGVVDDVVSALHVVRVVLRHRTVDRRARRAADVAGVMVAVMGRRQRALLVAGPVVGDGDRPDREHGRGGESESEN